MSLESQGFVLSTKFGLNNGFFHAAASGLLLLIAVVILLYYHFVIQPRSKNFFLPASEVTSERKKRRVPIFFKLLFLSILSIVPLLIAALLMFFSFQEIIDIYLRKPVLWNLSIIREEFIAALQGVQLQTSLIFFFTTILVITVSVMFSRMISDSLRRISLGMQRISKGDFSFRLIKEDNDEIGDLVTYFNNMSAEIKRARDIMENWNRELEIKVEERTNDLRKAMRRLMELDRLKNEFISIVSHELRTPVTSADGYISLFLTGVAGPITEDQRKYLTIVKENNQRLITLIDRLLDFSQIESGRFVLNRELISMHGLINSVIEILKPQFEKGQVALSLKLEAQNDNFVGDREKMGGALISLLENAIKFARKDKVLSVEIATRNKEGMIEVSVTDNGIGIEKKFLDKIFEKFYQIEDALTRKVGGVGLGLALVKEIIEHHHGKIWAESEGAGKGSRFVFTLPMAEKI